MDPTFLFWNSNRWWHKRQKFKNSTPTVWKSMGIVGFCYISQERLPQAFFSCVAISWNFKMRLGQVWTNSMVGVAHPLLYFYFPWLFSTCLWCKCLLFFGGDCIKVMSLLIDLRIKSVTYRWAITGKSQYLQPVKRKLSTSVFSHQGVLYFIGFCLGILKWQWV